MYGQYRWNTLAVLKITTELTTKGMPIMSQIIVLIPSKLGGEYMDPALARSITTASCIDIVVAHLFMQIIVLFVMIICNDYASIDYKLIKSCTNKLCSMVIGGDGTLFFISSPAATYPLLPIPIFNEPVTTDWTFVVNAVWDVSS